MKSRFDDLWTSAADDGASCPVGVFTSRDGVDDEVDELMKAWLRERTDRIEGSLVLDEVNRVLRRLLADGEVSPRGGRHVKGLIRSIRALHDADRSRDEDFLR